MLATSTLSMALLLVATWVQDGQAASGNRVLFPLAPVPRVARPIGAHARPVSMMASREDPMERPTYVNVLQQALKDTDKVLAVLERALDRALKDKERALERALKDKEQALGDKEQALERALKDKNDVAAALREALDQAKGRVSDQELTIRAQVKVAYNTMQELCAYKAVLDNLMLIEICLRAKYPEERYVTKMCKRFYEEEVDQKPENKEKVLDLARQLGCVERDSEFWSRLPESWNGLSNLVHQASPPGIPLDKGWYVGGSADGCSYAILAQLLFDDADVRELVVLPTMNGDQQVYFLNRANKITHILKPGHDPIPYKPKVQSAESG